MRELEIMKKSKVWAVVGVSNDINKYSYRIYNKLKEKGYEVYGVNPNYGELEGDKVYKNLTELPVRPEVVVFVVRPEIGLEYVRECIELKIDKIWLQPGTVSAEIIQQANNRGIEVIEACVLVVSGYL